MKTSALLKLIPALTMGVAASLAQAGSVELEGYTLSWDSPNLAVVSVGTTLHSPTTIDPVPDFSQDSVFTVVHFSWNNALIASGQDTGAWVPLPVFNVTAAEGWALTQVFNQFNGTVTVTGQGRMRSAGTPTLTFDQPADYSDHYVYPGTPARSGKWLLSNYATNAIQCQDGVCTGARQATLDWSKTYQFEFGPEGGNASFNFQPTYSTDGHSYQFFAVGVERLPVPVPEPSTALLMGCGLGLLALMQGLRGKPGQG